MAFYYDDDIDEEDEDEEEDDEDEEEDDEDEDDEDGYGDDTGDGYGEDVANQEEQEQQEEQERQEQEEKEKKKKEKEEKEGKEGKGGKLTASKKGGKNDPTNPKVLKKEAKRHGFPGAILPFYCPTCKKLSLFVDKPAPMMIRGILSCWPGIVPKDKVFMCVCLNKKCKSYWPTWGVKFYISAGKFGKVRNIFHIVR